jgi:hypothetical protein
MARNTYRTLADITKIPVPASTDTYTPVPQHTLVRTVADTFEKAGYIVKSEAHQVHRKRPLFISTMDIGIPDLQEDPRLKWTVGVMNSYDKTMANRLIFGGHVFACTNGLVISDHVLSTKHTTHVWDRLPSLINAAVRDFEGEVNQFYKREEVLMERSTDETSLAYFTMQLARRGILPKSKATDFYEESITPSFDYQTPGLCLWNLQAAYTHLAKEMNPVERPQRILSFDKALRQHYAIA